MTWESYPPYFDNTWGIATTLFYKRPLCGMVCIIVASGKLEAVHPVFKRALWCGYIVLTYLGKPTLTDVPSTCTSDAASPPVFVNDQLAPVFKSLK